MQFPSKFVTVFLVNDRVSVSFPGANRFKEFEALTVTVVAAQLVGRLGSDGFWDQDYGWGSEYAALLAHAEGALYGTELGSVTLKRIGFVLLFSN